MSRAVLKGNASGTGTVTLSSPNTNDNYTLELPTDAGTVLNTASDIEAQVKTATSATGDAPIFSCRAWVNFNGTGTVAIRASGNVSSITDLGTGTYQINYTTAMPDADYSGVVTAKGSSIVQLRNLTTLKAEIFTGIVVNFTGGGAAQDADVISMSIFR